MPAETGTPRPQEVGDDEIEALILKAADWIREPGPSLINTLAPIRWPAVAHEEALVMAKRIRTAATPEKAYARALLLLEQKYSKLFVVQAYAKVMGTPLAQPRPPEPTDLKAASIAKLMSTFADGCQTLLSSLALDSYRLNLQDVAMVLVAHYWAPGFELANEAERCGDTAYAARVREHMTVNKEDGFLTEDQLEQILHGAACSETNSQPSPAEPALTPDELQAQRRALAASYREMGDIEAAEELEAEINKEARRGS